MIKKHKRTHTGWMRRTSRIYLDGVNQSKIDKLKMFLNQYQNAINYCVIRYWSAKNFENKLAGKEITDDVQDRFGLTARLSQCVGKQAKEIVRSQTEHSKRKRRMPRFTSHTANIDSRFVTIEPFKGCFDMCLKLSSGVPKLVVPFNWTKHANKFRDNGWVLAKSIRQGYNKNGLFTDLIFEKEKPKWRGEGKIIGIDRGFTNMLVTSDDQYLGGTDLKDKIKQAGKRRKSYHHYIETETNRHLKGLNLENIKEIAVEDLKNVKKHKRGKFSRNTNRLLSFWHYAKVGKHLQQLCEEKGIRLNPKNPWKTSQRCYVCGNIDRRNRNKEKFLCLRCGHMDNADHNASKNLELLGLAGVYSLHSLPSDFMEGM